MYCIQHCFICRTSAVPEDVRIEPRTVVSSALVVRRSNHSAILWSKIVWIRNSLFCAWTLRFYSSLLPLPRFEPVIFLLAGRLANHWATSHPSQWAIRLTPVVFIPFPLPFKWCLFFSLLSSFCPHHAEISFCLFPHAWNAFFQCFHATNFPPFFLFWLFLSYFYPSCKFLPLFVPNSHSSSPLFDLLFFHKSLLLLSGFIQPCFPVT